MGIGKNYLFNNIQKSINNIKGVTNPDIRNKKPREPVFLLTPDFIKGGKLINGIYSNFGPRPISLKGINGNIQLPYCKIMDTLFTKRFVLKK